MGKQAISKTDGKKITGGARCLVVVLCALMAGNMVYVPFLRYSYYDQMTVLFTQYRHVVDASKVNSFIGLFGIGFGIVCTAGYFFGGIFADKLKEKWLLILGGILMGICCIWFGFVPGKTAIIIIHILYGVGTSFMIWSAYLKLTRKMGTGKEQGRMFSTSEFVRGIFGTLIGFTGVALLGKAALSGGGLDPEILGHQWKILHLICGILFFAFAVIIAVLVPSNVIGAEEKNSTVQQKFSMGNVVKVIKMPGTWMIALLILCCFSFTSAGNGYIGAYTVNVLGVSETMASTFAIFRNYIIAAIMTFLIGFVADKVGSKAKTLAIYLGIATVLAILLIITKNWVVLCIAVSFVFAIVYSGMRGIYFATLNEVGIPLEMTGIATGIISVICYLPDVYFAKIAGYWLDNFGIKGYDYIWIYTIVCGIAGVVVGLITYKYSLKLINHRQSDKNNT